VASAVITVAGFELAARIAASSSDQKSLKLEGAWVPRDISCRGVPGPHASQWSYALSPDALGRCAGINRSIEVSFPDNPLPAHDFT